MLGSAATSTERALEGIDASNLLTYTRALAKAHGRDADSRFYAVLLDEL